MTYFEEHIEAQRENYRRFFSPKELRSKLAKNPVTRASLIERYHALHTAEIYPFPTTNVIPPKVIVAIINHLKSQ